MLKIFNIQILHSNLWKPLKLTYLDKNTADKNLANKTLQQTKFLRLLQIPRTFVPQNICGEILANRTIHAIVPRITFPIEYTVESFGWQIFLTKKDFWQYFLNFCSIKYSWLIKLKSKLFWSNSKMDKNKHTKGYVTAIWQDDMNLESIKSLEMWEDRGFWV